MTYCWCPWGHTGTMRCTVLCPYRPRSHLWPCKPTCRDRKHTFCGRTPNSGPPDWPPDISPTVEPTTNWIFNLYANEAFTATLDSDLYSYLGKDGPYVVWEGACRHEFRLW